MEKLEDLEVHHDVDFLADFEPQQSTCSSKAVSCSSIESDICNQSLASSQLPTSSEKLDSVCKHVLQGVFSGKDIQALSAKATQLVEEGSIRDGFDSQSHFVKSTSSSNPHTMKKLASRLFACGKECLGYKTRNLCSHVISVAFHENQLQEFLSKFKVVKKKRSPNLTALTTFGVNTSAGKKRPIASRSRRKSPDPMTSVTNTGELSQMFLQVTVVHNTEILQHPSS